MEDPRLTELTRTLGDQYDLEFEADGRVILTPKATWAAAQARLGLTDPPAGEFERLFGDLPTGPF